MVVSEVTTAGVPLESAHAMPKRLAAILQDDGEDFDAVIVLGGSNDLWKGDADAIWDSLQQLHEQVRTSGCALGLGTLPPFEPKIFDWLSWLKYLTCTSVGEQTEATRVFCSYSLRTLLLLLLLLSFS